MAADLRKLKPLTFCSLLNSTPLGTVINDRQLRRHRSRAGLRIAGDADGKTVDALRYLAWAVAERHLRRKTELAAAQAALDRAPAGYDAHKERARKRNATLSQSGRDIGTLAEVARPERRLAAARNFQLFCESYTPRIFCLPWSPDHLKVIGKIEQAVLHGGLFAMAMPRGSGKTSLCEIACLWALLYGHRRFVALIGSDEEHARDMLESIKAELEHNELLEADFPEVCTPIRMLEGIHQRASGQLYLGAQTSIGWTASEIVLPTMPVRCLDTGSAGSPPVISGPVYSPASGGIIRVAGLTGRIRGMKYKRPDGDAVRPSLVLIDDPQTDESARSPSQCASREAILAGAVLGLAGPNTKIAGLMTLTVVQEGDLADRLLNREKHPQWQGERTKMLYSMPTDEALWARYAVIRADGLRAGQGLAPATTFYRKHRDAMDEGALVAWPERFNTDEASAIQHAMNLRLQNEHAFCAEYQNTPIAQVEVAADLLSADQIVTKLGTHRRGVVPTHCRCLTMFIDVQGKALYYMVVGWTEDFCGYIVDYGTEPDQRLRHFTLRDIRRTLDLAHPGRGPEGQIYAGLTDLVGSMLERQWPCEDGEEHFTLDQCLIDANWGNSTEIVYQFCREQRAKGAVGKLVMPSHGKYVGAASIPIGQHRKKPGERVGLNWRVPLASNKRSVRHVLYDTNYWKSFVQSRLATPIGDAGCLSLYNAESSPQQEHQLLAEHLTSEYRVKTAGRGRTVEEWKLRLGGLDNHWLDCLVGCAVGASMNGAVLHGTDEPERPRVKVSFSERQRLAQQRRGW